MKKPFSRFLSLVVSLCLALCAVLPCAALADTEIVVFAAASMTETLTAVKALYEAEHPGVVILCNFDSSGTLKTQIVEGAECDLFISASPKQMDQMDINASAEVNTDGLDLVDSATRVDLLENKVTLAVAPDGTPKVTDLADAMEKLMAGKIFMAIGNSDVPVGQYTQKIFAFFGVDETAVQNSLTYGTNVKEVTTQVSEGSADCGIIYATDACAAGLTVLDTATGEMCGRVIYPAAVLKNAAQHDEAADFLDFLKGPEASAVFAGVGFTSLCGE